MPLTSEDIKKYQEVIKIKQFPPVLVHNIDGMPDFVGLDNYVNKDEY